MRSVPPLLRSAYIQRAPASVRQPCREAVRIGRAASWQCGISTSARSHRQTRMPVQDHGWRGLFSSGGDSAASNEAEQGAALQQKEPVSFQ